MKEYQPSLIGIGVYENTNVKIISGICLYNYAEYTTVNDTVVNRIKLMKDLVLGINHEESIISSHVACAPWLDTGYNCSMYGVKNTCDALAICNFSMTPEEYVNSRNPIKTFYEHARISVMEHYRIKEENIVRNIPDELKTVMKELASLLYTYGSYAKLDESGTYRWMDF